MMTPALLTKLRSKKAIPCTKCDCEALRCRIMLYDDGEGDPSFNITSFMTLLLFCLLFPLFGALVLLYLPLRVLNA